MEQTPVIKKIACSNKQCGQKFEIVMPSQPGKYTVECPYCHSNVGFTIQQKAPVAPKPAVPKPVVPTPVVPAPAPAPSPRQAPAPAPAPAVAPNNQLREPKERLGDFVVGRQEEIPCAFDCGYIHRDKPQQLGKNIFLCPHCKGRTFYEARSGTIVIGGDSRKEFQAFRGKLVLLRKGFSFNKDFHLNMGSNVIGRFDTDPQGRSDISISDDPSMSRRSVDVRVSYSELNGYSFQIFVLRATNPVLVNREPLRTSESFSLNFGDSIIMGKTQFRLEKDI